MDARVHVLTPSYTSVLDDPRVMSEGRILASLGYRVTVLGVGLDKSPVRTEAHGMAVTILPLVNSYRPLAVVRALMALLRGRVESDSGTDRRSTYGSLVFFNLWVLRLALADRPAVIHCQEHQPLPAAWLLARLLRIPLVYDSHENTSLNRAGIGSKGALTIRLERFFLSRVDAVITVGEHLARSLEQRGARRAVVVGNWKRPGDFSVDHAEQARLRQELGLENASLVISYFGSLDPTRDLRPLLDAVAAEPRVHLLIAGRGSEEPLVISEAKRAENIHWLGWLPLAQVPGYTMLSDVIYCSTNAGLRQRDYQMPNKLFDAFVAGKAVIAREGPREMGELLRRFPAGIILADVTPDALREAFHRLMEPKLLRRLQDAAAAGGHVYNADVAVARLQELFNDLTHAGPRHGQAGSTT